jgi:Mrp family chromosome partitioning ATPase
VEVPQSDSFQPTVLGAMRRYRLLVVLLVLACGAIGAGYAAAGSHKYQATASVVVQDPRQSVLVGGTDASSGNYNEDQVAIMKLPSVIQSAAGILERQTGLALSIRAYLARMTIVNSSTSDLITVTFEDPDSSRAQSGANSELQAYEAQVLSMQSAQVDATLANIDQATAKLDTGAPSRPAGAASGSPASGLLQQLLALRAEVVADRGSAGDGISAASPARLATASSGSSKPKLALLGGVIGLLIGGCLSYLLAARRPRLAHRLDPEAVLGAPLMGEIAHFRKEGVRGKLPSRDRPGSATAEAFRFASASVAMRQSQSAAVVVAVISACSADGKTTIAANLAISLAQEGKRVLVVDADVERQGLTLLLKGTGRTTRQVSYFDGSGPVADAVLPIPLGDHVALSLLPAGVHSFDGSPTYAKAPSRRILDALRGRFDVIIIDTPPMLSVAYASKVARNADLSLVVVRHDSAVSDLQELDEQLRLSGLNVAGYIYNCAPRRRRSRRASGRSIGAVRAYSHRAQEPADALLVP